MGRLSGPRGERGPFRTSSRPPQVEPLMWASAVVSAGLGACLVGYQHEGSALGGTAPGLVVQEREKIK